MNETFLRPFSPFLEKQSKIFLTIYCSVFGFINYFSMYGFKTPFKAASYLSVDKVYGQYDYKTVLALGQVLGYSLSTILGVKIVSEIGSGIKKVFILLGLIILSQFGLVLFGLLPVKFKVIGIFFSNLPLGMIWGREGTDFIVATMSASYMVALGVVKDMGTIIIDEFHIDQFWMPSVAGAICFVPFIISLFFLHQIPPPNLKDVELKTKRKPMFKKQRFNFIKEFWPGLLLVNLGYLISHAYLDYRDTFQIDICKELGIRIVPGMFSLSELIVGISVTLVLACLVLIKSNYFGFLANCLIVIGGMTSSVIFVILFDLFKYNGFIFVVGVGISISLTFAPFGASYYERMVANLKLEDVTTAFPMQVTSSFGIIGACLMYTLKMFLGGNINHVKAFKMLTYFCGIFGTIANIFATFYFIKYKANILVETERNKDLYEEGLNSASIQIKNSKF